MMGTERDYWAAGRRAVCLTLIQHISDIRLARRKQGYAKPSMAAPGPSWTPTLRSGLVWCIWTTAAGM